MIITGFVFETRFFNGDILASSQNYNRCETSHVQYDPNARPDSYFPS